MIDSLLLVTECQCYSNYVTTVFLHVIKKHCDWYTNDATCYI